MVRFNYLIAALASLLLLICPDLASGLLAIRKPVPVVPIEFGLPSLNFLNHGKVKSRMGAYALKGVPTHYTANGCKKIKKVYNKIDNNLGVASMSVASCFAFCAKREGYSYFGISEGNKCWCGKAFDGVDAGSQACDSPCPGFPKEMCGGIDATNVFSMFDCQAPQNATGRWLTGADGVSCDNVCAAQKMHCNAYEQSGITSNKLIADAFKLAGHTCKSFAPPSDIEGAPFSTDGKCFPMKVGGLPSKCASKVTYGGKRLCYCSGEAHAEEGDALTDLLLSTMGSFNGESCGQDKDNIVQVNGKTYLSGTVNECKIHCWRSKEAGDCHGFTYDSLTSKCTFHYDVTAGPVKKSDTMTCYFKIL